MIIIRRAVKGSMGFQGNPRMGAECPNLSYSLKDNELMDYVDDCGIDVIVVR
jgi:hypothetical protein